MTAAAHPGLVQPAPNPEPALATPRLPRPPAFAGSYRDQRPRVLIKGVGAVTLGTWEASPGGSDWHCRNVLAKLLKSTAR